MRFLTALNWRFCLEWTLATTIAIALGAALGPIGFLGGPLLLAIAQGYVLKRHRIGFLPWGIATGIGGYIAIVLFVAAVLWGAGISLSLIVFVSGAIIGLAQALVLRRYRSRYWVWWPLINAVVLTISLFWFVPGAVDAFIYGSQRTPWVWIGLAIVAGLVGGFLKGLALIWLLNKTVPQP